MYRVKVALADRGYEIQIGAGAIDRLPRALGGMKSRRGFMIADQKLKSARALTLRVLRAAGWTIDEIAVPAGEALKSVDSVLPLYGELLRRGADRQSVLFALGGGSVGDAVGFVASTFMRGIPWVGIPTTLLAQVDSAVGGKTAINHPVAKNLIGTTYQPVFVCCDTDFLDTLSDREMISGLGEMIKYGLLYDPPFLAQLKRQWRAIVADRKPSALALAIQRSLKWKARIVAQDEHDRKGLREALNFGHTFGHALEAATAYQRYQHGEAVLCGMRFALALSRVRGKLSPLEHARLDAFLAELPVPAIPAALTPARIFSFMKKDKKVESGKPRFVLLSRPGQACSDREISAQALSEAYRLAALPREPSRRGRPHQAPFHQARFRRSTRAKK